MIKRYQFIAYLNGDISADTVNTDVAAVTDRIRLGECLTVAAYRYCNAIFLYYEALNEELTPDVLLPSLTGMITPTPYATGYLKWKPLTNVYYTFAPKSTEDLIRECRKTRIGKIAYLHREKIPSYIYYHKALVDEGLYFGDKYLFISLIDNLLFAYCEEPRINSHIKSELNEESAVINEWKNQDPRSHFDRTQTDGENNFLILEPIFTIGKEDL